MEYEIRQLMPEDAGILDAFLCPHTAEAYWMRSNALKGGLFYEGKYLQAEYFGAFRAGDLVGVVSYSWLNTILVYAEELGCLAGLAEALAPRIRGRTKSLEGLLGLKELVDELVRCLGIPNAAFRESGGDDKLYRLSLDKMIVPQAGEGLSIRRAIEGDYEQIVSWRVDFNIESLGAMAGPALERKVRKEIRDKLTMRELFVLEKGDKILSFCGIGGHILDMRMIGPVWTPVESRCRGYGRSVVAGGLRLLADENPEVKQAALFAVRPDAIRAYEALGFRRIADWRLALLKEDYRFGTA